MSDIIAPGQKWHNYDTSVLLEIEKVNTKNATFAGTYGIIRDGTISKFPFRGEFDPVGITIGWVVLYWNKYINDHALGARTGYARIQLDDQRASMSMTRLIAHEGIIPIPRLDMTLLSWNLIRYSLLFYC